MSNTHSMVSKALFIDFKEGEIPSAYLDRINKILTSYEYISRDGPKLAALLVGTEIILCKFSTKIDKEIINAAPKLKYIGVLGTAFDAVDIRYARQKGITVCNLGGYSTEAVSEFFFATLFEVARELEKAKQQAKREDYSSTLIGIELKGKTLGVLGVGKIGGRIAEIGLGVGMKVIYFDKENKPTLDSLGAQRKELDVVFSQSDFVSLNLILNQETMSIINQDRIQLLKTGCIFINLSPPTLVDQKAMIERARRGAVTFIFDHSDDIESSLAKEFLATPNCIVYPPIGFRTNEANTAKWEILTSNIEKFIQGIPQNVVS